jgi:hypothetical protein
LTEAKKIKKGIYGILCSTKKQLSSAKMEEAQNRKYNSLGWEIIAIDIRV